MKESKQARYGRLSKNPGTRASVPSQYLSPEHRRQREMNARLNTPVGAGTTVTNRDVGREAQANANLRYGGQESELTSQFSRSVVQQQRIPQYMDAYRQQIKDAQAKTQAAYATAAQNARGLGQAMGNTAGDASVVQGMQADAAQRGATVDPNALNTAVQAGAVRQAGGNSLASLAETQGANANGMYNSQIANVGLKLVEELSKESGVQNEIGRNRRQVASEKGAYVTGQRAEISGRERKAGLENLVFAADTQKAQADAVAKDQQLRSDRYNKSQDRQFKREDDARADRSESRQAAADKRAADREAYQREHGLGPYKPPSKGSKSAKAEGADSKKVRRAILQRQGGVANWAKQKGYNLKDKGDRASLVRDMRQRHGRDRTDTEGRTVEPGWFDNGIQEKALSAAIDLAADGKISSANLRWLRKNSIFVTSKGDYWAKKG